MQNITDFVYVIHAIGTSRIKFGYSADPASRLKGLQTGSPYTLQILATFPGNRQIESALHNAFAPYRKDGEWFEVPPFVASRIYNIIKDTVANYEAQTPKRKTPESSIPTLARRRGRPRNPNLPSTLGDYYYWTKAGNGLKLEYRKPGAYKYLRYKDKEAA